MADVVTPAQFREQARILREGASYIMNEEPSNLLADVCEAIAALKEQSEKRRGKA